MYHAIFNKWISHWHLQDLKGIMLSESNLSQKDLYCMILCMWCSGKERHMGTADTGVVVRFGGEGRVWLQRDTRNYFGDEGTSLYPDCTIVYQVLKIGREFIRSIKLYTTSRKKRNLNPCVCMHVCAGMVGVTPYTFIKTHWNLKLVIFVVCKVCLNKVE